MAFTIYVRNSLFDVELVSGVVCIKCYFRCEWVLCVAALSSHGSEQPPQPEKIVQKNFGLSIPCIKTNFVICEDCLFSSKTEYICLLKTRDTSNYLAIQPLQR